MYEAFYGLTEKPFNLTPDPRFLFLSEKHEEAFAHLLYGIQNRSGFIMVSGEIGTGKTTICRSLLKQLDEETEVAFIFNPRLSPEELLGTINADFGLTTTADTVRGLVDELNGFLLERATEGKNCVLIIDEAQNLGIETLEQVRLLSNLETETEKLLQIVLIGQPELADKLTLPELRQLNQRITARYHLGPLSYAETLNYIAFRLNVAGGRKRVRFTRRAVRLVYSISQGTPRVINALCDRALLIGFTKEASKITPSLVKQAAKEVQGEQRPRFRKLNFQRFLPASAFVSASAVILLLILVTSGPLPSFDREAIARWISPSDSAAAPVSVAGDSEMQGSDAGVASSGESNDVGASASASSDFEVANVAEAASLPVVRQDDLVDSTIAESALDSTLRVASIPDGGDVAGGMAALNKVGTGGADGYSGVIPDVLRAWNLAVLGDLPMDITVETLRGFAASNGLRFTTMKVTLEEIMIINLPVITRGVGAADAEWYALLGFEGDRARVSSLDASGLMDRADLYALYSGQAIYLWPDADSAQRPLRAGSEGPYVRRLQGDLRTLGLFDHEATGVYDAKTVEIVTKIQRVTGLRVDGIAGPQTRMVIASWLPSPETPSLGSPGLSSSMRARVLASPGMIVADSRAIDARRAVRRAERETSVEGQSAQSALPNIAGASGIAGVEAGTGPGEDGARSANVVMEPLVEQRYRPQLEPDGARAGGSVTPSAGRIVPIVPRSDRKGE